MAFNRTPNAQALRAYKQWCEEGDDIPGIHFDEWVHQDGSISLYTPGEVRFTVTGERTFPPAPVIEYDQTIILALEAGRPRLG